MTVELKENGTRKWYKVYARFEGGKPQLGTFEYSPFGYTQARLTDSKAKELILNFRKDSEDLDPWVIEERKLELIETLRSQVEALVKGEMSIEEKCPKGTEKITEPAWKKYQL